MLSIEPMKLVIFDCDGTIVDSQHAIVEAMNMAFDAAGLARPARAHVLSIVGLSLPNACLRLLRDPDIELAATVAEHYKAAFQELRARPGHEEPMFPGAREAIAALAARPDYLLGVATGKSRRGVDILFEREGLTPYFHTIQTSDYHPSKPDPAMILQAMAEAGAAPDTTVMVGDTTFDVEMAEAAGVASIAVGWGYHPLNLLVAAGADAVIEDYATLVPTLDRLIAHRAVLRSWEATS